ncbi:RidA family protein [Goodfellowiella coeruleoviolacea]|uniref:Enamine deaminase RidA, house cleaning of reactive enamine intermediates, YjgF/YER057c/UK114 family n=1 Tax=Goodfellowiella coeruleoviolacea TaxID=334858 RepID=A0AAE3GG29_9PSEU|nr:RidA family protein [Goodfellowiella coeruleoviolacea]MCP2166737.1 Enamine deaminase RidA, house cleaning of reactive enamine intermediates, YjgF/YER057c/UK114 family [Goodfellowiella coeruleoviolacea]
MPHDIINPDTLHDPVGFGYSHVATTSGELVFIAGQYASDDTGQVVPGDFRAQMTRALENLGKALAAVGLDYQHVVRVGSYVVDHDADKLAVIGELIGGIWGARPPTQTLVGVAALALPGMLYEIDAVAVRP